MLLGHTGVGLVSLKRAQLFHAVPSTHDFRVLVGLGRVLRSVIPVGRGRVVHVVVVYGFHLPDCDPEKLAHTEQLFQAVLCELRVVGEGHPQLLLGDFNVEPSKVPCLAKGVSEGFFVEAICLPLLSRMFGILFELGGILCLEILLLLMHVLTVG